MTWRRQHRLTRLGWALLAIATGPCRTCTGQVFGQGRAEVVVTSRYHVVIDTRVQAALGVLADTATTEHIACLIGVTYADSTTPGDSIALIDLAVAPRHMVGNDSSVTAEACYVATLAHWHNHIFAEAQRQLRKIGREIRDTIQACGLSQPDFILATQPFAERLQVVQVNTATFCWWTKRSLLAYRETLTDGWPIWIPAVDQRTNWGQDPLERP